MCITVTPHGWLTTICDVRAIPPPRRGPGFPLPALPARERRAPTRPGAGHLAERGRVRKPSRTVERRRAAKATASRTDEPQAAASRDPPGTPGSASAGARTRGAGELGNGRLDLPAAVNSAAGARSRPRVLRSPGSVADAS